MSYAIKIDGTGWRAVNGPDDVAIDEEFSLTQPEAVVSSSAVPRAVTMRQARLALHAAGMLAAVDAAVDAMPGEEGVAARIEWEYSQEVQRDKALVLALAPVLGLSEGQLDGLFIAAAAL